MSIDNLKLEKEIKNLSKPLRFRIFTTLKMPSSAFVGLKIEEFSTESCTTSLPGGWRTQNPFRSMYWAVQGMAAEMSTGAFPFAISRSISQNLRMYVIGVESDFIKVARGKIVFYCSNLFDAYNAIEETIRTKKSAKCDLISTGKDSSGEVVSKWIFKWNFLALERK